MASFPSSYIPTTTASATRAADSLTVTSVSGIAYPLSLFAEFERVVDTGGNEIYFVIDVGASSDSATLSLNSSDLMRGQVSASSASQMDATVAGTVSIGATTKSALRVASNDGMVCKGRTLGTQDTTLTLPSSPTRLLFGVGAGAATPSFGYLRRAAIWSSALSDANLQTLTT